MSSIFNDPIEWGRKATGTKIRLALGIIMNIICATFIVIVSWSTIGRTSPIVPLVVLCVTVFPSYYLYSMYKMIHRIDDLTKNGASNQEGNS